MPSLRNKGKWIKSYLANQKQFMPVEEVYQKINDLSKNLSKYVDSNGLALNKNKKKYMMFTKYRRFALQEIANVFIERKISVRFRGVMIDEKLSWPTHIAIIKTKMARYLGIMYKTINHLPAETCL